ncbi:RNA-directed DNA polymerase, eukaryota, reverse transcriptase zinc-binding domain protein [Tanacetum coccineum]
MLIFKVDFEKSFDSVSWKYLDFVLHRLGFGSKWHSWIRACLHLSRASILVNGSPTSEFSIKRGLRQGDPLSPFLFILVMEGLHCALSTAVSSNLIHGINLGSPDLTLSHLFYGDDVIINTEWNPVSDDEVSNMARNSGCAMRSFPFTYLGLPIGSTMNHISSARVAVALQFSGCQDSKKLIWIKWANVLSSFEKGGLNIGSLKSFNLALLQKWRLRLLSFLNAIWVKVIKAIHEQEGGFDTYGCKFNGVWARIVGSSNFLHSKNIIPLNPFHFKVGCSTRIRFWKDI